MLTQAEQDQIMRKVNALLSRQATLRALVSKSEMAPKRAKESMAEAKEEFRDLLKEIG